MKFILKYILYNSVPLAICILWWFPVTYFGAWTDPIGTEMFAIIRFPVVACLFCWVLIQKRIHIDLLYVCFLVVALLSSLNSAYPSYSLIKTAGLSVIIGTLGPLIRSDSARALRTAVWRNLLWSAVTVTILSVIWKVADLPGPVIYTKDGWPGITSHAMLFGPIAGISSVVLLANGLSKNNWIMLVLSAVCYIAVFPSLSRIAIISSSCGIVAVLVVAAQAKNKTQFLWGLIPLSILLAVTLLIVPSNNLPEWLTDDNAFMVKQGLSSRESLWEARMDEFSKNPWIGCGIGMGSDLDSDSSGDSNASRNVEPGSSYLATLSMTGLSGACIIVFALVGLIYKSWKRRRYIPLKSRLELAGIGSLLLAHGMAEGWIMSAGAIICIIFWLWLGKVRDSIDESNLSQKTSLVNSRGVQ